ncbi:MotA/TolQ/ExbB proton channel family protein [Treponema vincentii]|uniref:MotA/TolQ/ExbB proton channel family protein n=1 Tax=Treponema vincentii TaxID=69710 RepID=A0A6P1Y186_9SPIR|nr:MotA/TolQ/ExbB proton channel family protein [Treponema vincentii]QHX43537.1 MotA/TolQ/ExbB proton channel family protein [Treponema vincentii]
MDGLYYFIDLMQKGKAVNYVILLLYLVVLATAAERLVYYISTQYKRKLFYSILKECKAAFLHKQVITQAAFQKKGLHNSCIESVGQVFFEYRSTQSGALAEAFERTVQGIIAVQERGFILFSRIAAVAPLLGLLGTVTGLMAAFQKIAALGGSVDITVLSGGIWEAMITTATGLVTAIFSFAVYELFDWVSMRRVRDMEQLISVLNGLHTAQQSSDVPAGDTEHCNETV